MSERALRYVAIGDSLSEGVGDEPWPDGTLRGWTDRLAELVVRHHGSVDYANFAVRGYRSRQVLETQVTRALALEPDVVTVTAGMNDLLRPRFDVDQLRQQLVGIVRPFTRVGTRVLVVPIPDLRAISPAGRVLGARRAALNEIYRHLAEHHGMEPPAETKGTIFEDVRAWADDRLHLSPLGHERLALAAASSLGLADAADWGAPPDGVAPRRTLRTDAVWLNQHVTPWLGRRLTGRSSGDDRVPKRPDLERFSAVPRRGEEAPGGGPLRSSRGETCNR